MRKRGDISDLIYSRKKSFYKVGILLLIVINVICTLSTLNIDIVILLEIYYLIISLVALIVICSTVEENNESKEFFYEASIIFVVISLFNSYSIVFKGTEIREYTFGKELEYFAILKLIYILLALDLLIKRMNGKENFKNTKTKVFMATIIGIISIPICTSFKEYNGFGLAILIIYSLKILKDIQRTEKDKKNVNYIKFYLVAFTIRNSILLGMNILNIENIFLDYISIVITFVSCTMLVVYTIGKVLNSPYANIQKKLMKSINEIEDLSIDLMEKNNEIEYRRSLINDTERIFKDFFRNIPMPIVIISSIKGNVIYVNKPGLKIFGEEKISDMLNRNLLEFIKIVDDQEFKNISNKAYIGEIIKNNKKVAIECDDKRIEEQEEIIIITDLTHKIEYTNIENIIKEKESQEEMKSKFLSNISHDLKTPINVLYSSAQVQEIFLKNKNIKELENHKNISKQNSFYLKRFANNVIDISKIEAGFLEMGSLEKDNIVIFVEDIFSSLVQYAKNKNILMIFDTQEEDIIVNFNKEYMERIILNIISNSIKYNKKNGEIFLDIKLQAEFVDIVIKDTGIGMEKEFLNNIFERYSKVMREDKGLIKSSGIGMYVVKKLVESQKGRIIVNSIYGEGTEVIIRFIREI
ncbi:ATP-binding protein [uncultured Clostridium sp.]|uniref:sensor histidine kinase n=1 Tax=uncultured Clostridium sp. TaxID=59620 RepID=UPI0026163E23|nr:ATP-binding protein [uncultured Clostridium sp.]